MSDGDQLPLSGEQAADLAALQRLAAEEAPVTEQGGQAVPAAARLPLEQEIAGMLKMMAGMVKPALPSVAELYPDEVCEAVGNSVAPVCRKHGWLADGIGGKYGEEIMALLVVGPLAWATVEAAKGDIGARKAVKSGAGGVFPAQSIAEDAPGAKTVQIGAVVTE